MLCCNRGDPAPTRQELGRQQGYTRDGVGSKVFPLTELRHSALDQHSVTSNNRQLPLVGVLSSLVMSPQSWLLLARMLVGTGVLCRIRFTLHARQFLISQPVKYLHDPLIGKSRDKTQLLEGACPDASGLVVGGAHVAIILQAWIHYSAET